MSAGRERPPSGQEGELLPGARVAPQDLCVKRKAVPSYGDALPRYRLPRVLRRMPASCRLVFAAFVALSDAQGRLEASTRELARWTGCSPTQVRRALRRLAGARLIRLKCPAGANTPPMWLLLWRAFPQGVRPHIRARESFYPEKRRISHTDSRPRLTHRAHRWAMARIREEVRGYPIPWNRRQRILNAIGAFLWRAIRAGTVRTAEALAKLVRRLIALLRQAEGVSEQTRRAFSWAGWAIREALGGCSISIEEERKSVTLPATSPITEQIRKEREEARAAWAQHAGPSWRELAKAKVAACS